MKGDRQNETLPLLLSKPPILYKLSRQYLGIKLLSSENKYCNIKKNIGQSEWEGIGIRVVDTGRCMCWESWMRTGETRPAMQPMKKKTPANCSTRKASDASWIRTLDTEIHISNYSLIALTFLVGNCDGARCRSGTYLVLFSLGPLATGNYWTAGGWPEQIVKKGRPWELWNKLYDSFFFRRSSEPVQL